MNPIYSSYINLTSEGKIEVDDNQKKIIFQLDELAEQIKQFDLASKSSALGWLFGRKNKSTKIHGMYLWGGVGRGKTMMMDLFFSHLSIKSKRRVHFHAFMKEIHERIHEWRSQSKLGQTKNNDPIPPIAERLAKEASVICFDEFSVTDIADAMILGRLFEALFARGIIIIATSNVQPEKLYHNGLNRTLFLPFIFLIKSNMKVVHLDSSKDYRLEKLQSQDVYYYPINDDNNKKIENFFKDITKDNKTEVRKIDIDGRILEVSRSSSGVALFSFAELCEQPRGASDYLAIAQEFHTIFLIDVPFLEFSKRNEAKRFITLVDIFYENNIKLIISAQIAAEELYHSEYGHEAFEFARTLSRLIEMRSKEYLMLPHASLCVEANGNITGLVET